MPYGVLINRALSFEFNQSSSTLLMSQAVYTKASRLLESLRADLELLESGRDVSAGVQGRVSASLTTLDRSVRDLQDFASREMDTGKREEAKGRVQAVREEALNMRRALERFKQRQLQRAQEERDRRQLLANSSVGTSAIGVAGGDSANSTAIDVGSAGPEALLDRQKASFQNSHNMVDGYLVQAQLTHERILNQGSTLKATQRRLLDMANTLGLSQNTIRWIDRRTSEDKYIFWIGVVVTLAIMYGALKWSGYL